jgi:cytochrome c peroxidase
MNPPGVLPAILIGATFLTCASASPSPPASAQSRDGSVGDPDPILTSSERALLATLSPSALPSPPPDVTNAHADDPSAAAFGQKLFFSRVFAGSLLDPDNNGVAGTLGKRGEAGKVACADCHLPKSAFSDTRSPSAQISLASGWGKRRAPSLFDVGQAKLIMWDGRRDALYNQVFGPIESPVEMNSSRLFVAEQVLVNFKADYEGVFGPLPPLDDASQFPMLTPSQTGCHPTTGGATPTCNGAWNGSPGDGAQYDSMTAANQDAVTRVVVNLGKAIGAYERLLGCGPSRFDQWMHGSASALSRSEQRGAQVFVGPGNCAGCHSGPFLSDQQFHNVGLAPTAVAAAFVDANDPGASAGVPLALSDPLNSKGRYSDGDDGRLAALVSPSLSGSFRTPTLRCVSQRPSFFHTAQARTLDAVVRFFDHGGDSFGFVGTSEVKPLGLTALQQADLASFLKALDGPGPAASLLAGP